MHLSWQAFIFDFWQILIHIGEMHIVVIVRTFNFDKI